MKDVIVPEEMESWFEDNGIEAMETMTELLKVQHKLALELTKLVLNHCGEEKKTKDEVFTLFKEASQLMAEQMDID